VKLSKLFLLLLPFLSLFHIFPHPIQAATSTFTVTVGNSPPQFTTQAYELPTSTYSNPSNVGATLSFVATAQDPNAGSYYLIVCSSNSVVPHDGSVPTCTSAQWCISSATASDSPATCSRDITLSETLSLDWYAFVCDSADTNAACGDVSVNTGDSGSPYFINNPPAFSGISNNGSSISIGSTVTWTPNEAADSDFFPLPGGGTLQDQVSLLVCKTAGVSGTTCDGGASDTYCQSDYSNLNPTCSYGIPPSTPTGLNHAYVYIFDSHGLESTWAYDGYDSSFTITNTPSSVSSISINSGQAITLTEGTTTPVIISATISDANGCQDISQVTAHLYRSGANKAVCISGNSNNNYCYPTLTCTAVSSGNTCDSFPDTSVDYTCTANLYYFADPTDALTQYSAENWLATLVVDDSSATTTADSATGVELNSLAALSVDTSIDYGTLQVGQKNDPIDKTTTVTATGNVGLDLEISGTQLTSVGNTIPASAQHYYLTSVAYDSASTLSTSATSFDFNCQKTTSSVNPATKSFYWGISIPSGIPVGNYTGTNTITAVKSEVAQW